MKEPEAVLDEQLAESGPEDDVARRRIPARDSDPPPKREPGAPIGLDASSVDMLQVKIDDLKDDDQTYMFRAALRVGPLKDSLHRQGQQVPIVVRKRGRGQRKYQVISGFRRVAAAKELGWSELFAIERELTDEEAFRASVLENTARKTYSDIDRGYVIRAYKTRGHTSTEIGRMMGLTKRQINNLNGLLELPELVQQAIDDPDQHFKTTHGLTLRKQAHKYPDIDYSAWIEMVNREELTVAKLTRALNKEYRPDAAPEVQSVFQDGTNISGGVFRFAPVKIAVANLSDAEKKRIKGELQKLIKQLG